MTGLAEGKWWSNGTVAQQPLVTIVTPTGKRSTGHVHMWTGPGECELRNGFRGVLLETWLRRAER
jgi:hypothetical protein